MKRFGRKVNGEKRLERIYLQEDEVSLEELDDWTLYNENLRNTGTFPYYKFPMNPEELFLAEEQGLIIDAHLKMLPEREEAVLRAYIFDGGTLQEIANAMHLSQERIRQIKGIALMRLRKHEKILLDYVFGCGYRIDEKIRRRIDVYHKEDPSEIDILSHKKERKKPQAHLQRTEVNMPALPENVGDIYFHDGRYFIGERNTSVSGIVNCKSGIILLYLLTNTAKYIPFAELSKISESTFPLSLVHQLANQMYYSRFYSIDVERESEAVRLSGPPLPHESGHYIMKMNKE
ncbi:MAG: sigma factor-like helix-turn-helix DNA-binding protein [Candidatus Aenigmarchaeota archaeon]|nr:sigma factor-like helix-turn-helix DNA-binding protein [Candidatus Aenigmarchaeota archaeon]MDI6722535.1 sigma factor-like helix-turn-helix DNA-binding protein [Candidatus Aenigmarchaeota archaeon]